MKDIIAAARQRVEEAVASLDVEDAELHDCDALLVKIQDAEIKLALALNHLDRAMASRPQ